ncbi:MAG: hypothetical protein RMJ84_06735 [Sandaracinaceae bacterium]|nr:hypothetical protein [Sandaracinaceae bacterium]
MAEHRPIIRLETERFPKKNAFLAALFGLLSGFLFAQAIGWWKSTRTPVLKNATSSFPHSHQSDGDTSAPYETLAKEETPATEGISTAQPPSNLELMESPESIEKGSEIVHPPQSSPPQETAKLRLERGRVAYFRCEGVPLRRGPYPCPRDLPLEAEAWASIEKAQKCFANFLHKEIELIWHWKEKNEPVLRLRFNFSPAPSSGEASSLLSCIRPLAVHLRPHLPTKHLVLSVRFAWSNPRL